MSNRKFFNYIPYGGDYNPDQWTADTWKEDMRLFKAAGVNFLTLPVFSWAKLQPSEKEFHFEWLDEILDLIDSQGIKVCLATPTAAQPPWMSRLYPEMMPVDIQGRKRVHGKRVNYCPNSTRYRQFSANIAQLMAERYKDHPALAMWHISNEYGTLCYCDTCAIAFRKWLKKHYRTVEELNRKWNMAFWGHTIYQWDDITVPSKLNDDDTCSPAKTLDYNRFMTDSTIDCYENELQQIRLHSPNVPATTNMSGFIKKLDQGRFSQHLDVVGWDNYPAPSDPAYKTAFKHDIMRGLKNGAPFFMMEQSPNQQNWQPYNQLKRPGEVRLLTYQALAHGADAVLFFQMRGSVGGVEKLHGAFIDHSGREDTRTYKEMVTLGSELKHLGKCFTGARTNTEVAILFDWDNWWAVERSSGPTIDLNFFDQAAKYYKALHRHNIGVDIIRSTSDLSGYKLVIAPVLYMIKEGVKESLNSFVSQGGTLITTFLSAITDENDQVITGGFPGGLGDLTGIWAEEIDALPPGKMNEIVMEKSFTGDESPINESYSCGLLCDLIHTVTAETLAVYGSDFYKGQPCLTRNQWGKGSVYYLATDGEADFIQDLLTDVCHKIGIDPLINASLGIEITTRETKDSVFTFIINHSNEIGMVDLETAGYTELISSRKITGSLKMDPREVFILQS